jgi:hypothetical protein
MSAPAVLSDQDSSRFLRVLPIDDSRAIVVFVRGAEETRSLRGSLVTVTSDSLLVTPSVELTRVESAEATRVVFTDELVVIGVEAGLVIGRTFDASLTPTGGPHTLPLLRDIYRGLFEVNGDAWLSEYTPTLARVMRLAPTSLTEVQRFDLGLAEAPAIAFDAAALQLFTVGTDTATLIRVEPDDLSMDPIPLTRTTWPRPRELLGLPVVAVSDAGTDVVYSAIEGGSSILTLVHVDRPTVTPTEVEVLSVGVIRNATVARLSSRAGAIFYAAGVPGAEGLYVQRIGCE